jgi:hypothetical protein
MPGEDLALPIERKVSAVLGHQNMSQETGGGQALGDRSGSIVRGSKSSLGLLQANAPLLDDRSNE